MIFLVRYIISENDPHSCRYPGCEIYGPIYEEPGAKPALKYKIIGEIDPYILEQVSGELDQVRSHLRDLNISTSKEDPPPKILI